MFSITAAVLGPGFTRKGAEIERKAEDVVALGSQALVSLVKIKILTYPAHGQKGQPGLVDTGNMLNSVQTEMIGPAQAIVWEGADYAHFLEFGTYKMGPFPHFVPAVEQFKPKWESMVAGMLT